MIPSTSLRTSSDQLLRGIPGAAEAWIGLQNRRTIAEPVLVILFAGGFYGASIGAWRANELAVYCAIKLPFLLLCTALVDALLNGLWALRLGLEISLGESLRAVLLSFALASLVLAAFAPVILFFDWTLPGPASHAAWSSHNFVGLAHVLAVAFAGCAAVRRQLRWLEEHCPKARHARNVVWLWLAMNLIVGAQLSWTLRPWFGSPTLHVEFLREHPFDGTFYESVFKMTRHLTP